jgi:hypothetical protein
MRRMGVGTVASPARTGQRALAVALVMGVTMNAFEAMAVVTAMPAVASDLHGDSLYGAAFSAYMLAELVALVAAGEQADRRGPALPFLVGVGFFAVGLLVAGAAPSMDVFVAGRALQGAGAGTIASIAYVAVGRAWPPEGQPRIFAWMSAGWIVPSLVAPVAAGYTAEHIGWRWVFLGLLPLLPVLLALALPSLRALPSPDQRPAVSRVPPALALAIGVGLVVAGLATDTWTTAVALAVPGVLIAIPMMRRVLPPGTLRARAGVPAAVACRLCVGVAFFGADTFVPLAATRIHGVGTLAAGIVITGASLTWSLGAALSARASKHAPAHRTVRQGFVLLAFGVLATVPVLAAGTPLAATFAAWMVAGLGIGLVFNTTSVTAMASAQPGSEGLIGSQLQVADALAIASVGGVGGALVGIADRTAVTLPGALTVQFGLSFGFAVLGALIAGRTTAR